MKLSIEELMELASSEEVEEELEEELEEGPVERFIQTYPVMRGDSEVPSAIIYDRFLDWCRASEKRVPMNLIHFCRRFGKYFRRKKKKWYTVFYLKSDIFEVTSRKKNDIMQIKKKVDMRYKMTVSTRETHVNKKIRKRIIEDLKDEKNKKKSSEIPRTS